MYVTPKSFFFLVEGRYSYRRCSGMYDNKDKILEELTNRYHAETEKI